jgi:hypothetical protein
LAGLASGANIRVRYELDDSVRDNLPAAILPCYDRWRALRLEAIAGF